MTNLISLYGTVCSLKSVSHPRVLSLAAFNARSKSASGTTPLSLTSEADVGTEVVVAAWAVAVAAMSVALGATTVVLCGAGSIVGAGMGEASDASG